MCDAYNAQHGDDKKNGKILEDPTDEVNKLHSTRGQRVATYRPKFLHPENR